MNRQESEDDGKPFPTRFACSLLVVGLGTVLGLVPWLALSLPPVPRTDLPWWQAAIFHSYHGQQVSAVSSRLQLLQNDGVAAVIVGPVYIPKASDLVWADDTLVSEGLEIGSTKEMDSLITEAHQKGLKVIVEFEPNHSERSYPWFENGEAVSPDSQYSDLYVWKNPRGITGTNDFPQPPNGWKTRSGEVAWTFSQRRQQFYFHHLDADHPDLNYRNPLVVQLIARFLSFWAKRGVDGFFLRNTEFLIEHEDTTAQDYVCTCHKDTSSHRQGSAFTTHQNGSLSVLSAWRTDLQNAVDQHIFLAAEACNCDSDLYREYYKHGVDLVVQPSLWEGQGTRDARCVWEKTTRWRAGLPGCRWPLWMEEEFKEGDDCRRSLISLLLSTLSGAMIRRDSNGPAVELECYDSIRMSTLRMHPAFIVGDTVHLLERTELLVFIKESEAKWFSKYIIAINFSSDALSLNIPANNTNPRAKIPSRGRVIIKTKPCSKVKERTDTGNLLPIGTVIDLRESFQLGPYQGIVIESL